MKKLLMIMAIAAVALSGCKPTEKNYRAAYDAAINKRQSVADSLEADGLVSADGPRSRNVDGKDYYFLSEIMKAAEGYDALLAVNVAVAQFKMPTNARSGVEALREKGYDARLAKGMGDKWFIIAGSFDSIKEATEFIDKFRSKNPSYSYIGLGADQPVIIRN